MSGERTLLNVFQTLLQISTVDYIQNMKMDMARHLLSTSASTVREIAELLGYADSFSFSKSFRRNLGLSPREYRKQSVSAPAASAERCPMSQKASLSSPGRLPEQAAETERRCP